MGHPNAGHRLTTFDPARPERAVGSVLTTPWAPLAARLAEPLPESSWSGNVSLRSRSLMRWAHAIETRTEAIAEAITHEVGKPIREATAEVSRAIAIIQYYAQAAYDPLGELLPPAEGSTRLHVERRPVGNVLAICPWNFPLAIPVWKVAPALAYGNRVVLRPSSTAIHVAAHIADTAAAALPDGVLHVWHGPTEEVEGAVEDRRIDAITFTGSVDVGRGLIRAAAIAGKPIQAEMGGHNAAIVLPDADVEAAARTIATSAMTFAGQKCTATRRVVAHRSQARDLLDALLAEIASLKVGDPLEPETDVGPMVTSRARATAVDALSAIPARRILAGGGVVDPGWYLQPTLVRVDDPAERIAQVETFGPILSFLVADDDAEAISIANGVDFGLVGAVYGRDLERATAVARALSCGLVRVNAPTTGVDFHAPFGGDGSSSYGPREQGRAVREFVTRTRTITVARA